MHDEDIPISDDNFLFIFYFSCLWPWWLFNPLQCKNGIFSQSRSKDICGIMIGLTCDKYSQDVGISNSSYNVSFNSHQNVWSRYIILNTTPKYTNVAVY